MSGLAKRKTHCCKLHQSRAACAKLGDVQVEGAVIEMQGIIKKV